MSPMARRGFWHLVSRPNTVGCKHPNPGVAHGLIGLRVDLRDPHHFPGAFAALHDMGAQVDGVVDVRRHEIIIAQPTFKSQPIFGAKAVDMREGRRCFIQAAQRYKGRMGRVFDQGQGRLQGHLSGHTSDLQEIGKEDLAAICRPFQRCQTH